MDTTILYYIFGSILVAGLIGQYLLNPYRKAAKLSLQDMSHEELAHILAWSIEYLSAENGVKCPNFRVGKVDEPEYGIIGLSKEKDPCILGIYVGDLDLIVINEKFSDYGLTLLDLFGTICHEFQHYLDKLSKGNNNQWIVTYTENLDFYENRAEQFEKAKSKTLLKSYVKDQIS